MFPATFALLDLDGTLIDSKPGILASFLATLRGLGHQPGDDFDIEPLIGPPLQDALRALLLRYGDHRVDEAVLAYRQHYGDSGLFESKLYPGIGDALRQLRQAGLRLYLATSKRKIFARRILQHFEVADCFDGIYGSVPGGALDHKPELFADIVARHDLDPARGVMVGDRRFDIAGAHAVGLRGLGVLWGYGSREELEAAGADRLVSSPVDLARTIMAMAGPGDDAR